jgi:hypothetical protein
LRPFFSHLDKPSGPKQLAFGNRFATVLDSHPTCSASTEFPRSTWSARGGSHQAQNRPVAQQAAANPLRWEDVVAKSACVFFQNGNRNPRRALGGFDTFILRSGRAQALSNANCSYPCGPSAAGVQRPDDINRSTVCLGRPRSTFYAVRALDPAKRRPH